MLINNSNNSLMVASAVSSTEEKISSLAQYWQAIDWIKLLDLVIAKSLSIGLICLLLFVFRRISLNILKKTFDKYRKKEAYSENRINTLYNLSRNFLQYFLLFIALYSILTILGIPVGSLIAGAGIVGVAIGLGAQGFINDVITGFFIILEKQLDVGDHVIIGAIEGTVVTIGLRTTQIKSFDGTLHFIPNREILIISNLSRGNQRVLIDIRINPDEDIKQIAEIIKTINQTILKDYAEIKSEPNLVGLVDLGNSNYAFRIDMYVLSGAQYRIKNELMTAYVTKLTKAGIDIPHSPINLTL